MLWGRDAPPASPGIGVGVSLREASPEPKPGPRVTDTTANLEDLLRE